MPPQTVATHDGTASPQALHPAGETPFDRATAHLDAPLAVVDLQAFDANAADLVRRSKGKPIRVASKSVRCRALLERVLAREGFAGIMSFTLAESLWLARSGFTDILLAYPSADRAGFAELTGDAQLAAAVTVMVDDPAQLELIDAARPAGGAGEEVQVCLELDTSYRLLGGRCGRCPPFAAADARPAGGAGPDGGAPPRFPVGGADGVRGACGRCGRRRRR
ncbi:alanine racemase [Streptomyces lydicus]|nr:alanine racemase [Streptomyces lydicus]